MILLVWMLIAVQLPCLIADKPAALSELPHIFEIFLPYRLDFVIEMYLTTIFPRRFREVVRNFQLPQNVVTADIKPIISIPNYSGGALFLGTVKVDSFEEVEAFLRLVESLAHRVFRTGLNDTTISGNFRIPLKGLRVDPATGFVYMNVDKSFPTDSFNRYSNFLKSTYFRLRKLTALDYQPETNIQSDCLVIGEVTNLAAIDVDAFNAKFSGPHQSLLGFATFDKILIKPEGLESERMKSIFHFDYAYNEPMIGIENVDEQAVAKEEAEPAARH